MKHWLKSWSFSRYLTVGTCLFVILSIAFAAHSTQELKYDTEAVTPSKLNVGWVKKVYDEYDELKWMVDDSEGSEHTISIAAQTLSKESPSFDHAIMSITAMNTFLDGKYEDYLEFISHQGKDDQLHWQSFRHIQEHILSVMDRYQPIESGRLRKLFEYAIVLNELFQSDVIVEKLKEIDVPIGNLSEVVTIALDVADQFLPTYQNLDAKEQAFIQKVCRLSHFDQMTRLLGGPDMFTPLYSSKILDQDPLAFEMGFFIYECNVAGILDQVNYHASLVYNEDIHQCLRAVKQACYMLKDESEMAAYNHYLEARAEWLGLDSGSPLHRVLTRIGAVLMLYKPEEGKVLKESLLRLASEDLSLVVEEFNATRKDMRYNIPSCLASVLVVLSNNPLLGESHQNRLEQTIQIGLPVFAKLFRYQKESHHRTLNMPINYENIVQTAEKEPEKLSETFSDELKKIDALTD